jgi:hypothetical protein
LHISWSAGLTNWVLKATDNLGDLANWEPVAALVELAGDRNVIELAPTEARRFFRLRLP